MSRASARSCLGKLSIAPALCKQYRRAVAACAAAAYVHVSRTCCGHLLGASLRSASRPCVKLSCLWPNRAYELTPSHDLRAVGIEADDLQDRPDDQLDGGQDFWMRSSPPG